MTDGKLDSRNGIDFGPEPSEFGPAPAPKPRHLSDYVYENILEKLISGQLGQGVKLPTENELARLFRVSRPTVRKALSRLQADGLVVSRKGSGNYISRRPSTYLMNLNPGEGAISQMLKSHELRIAMEGDAAALAAARRTTTELAKMKDALELQASSAAVSNLEVSRADMIFHETVAEATRNSLFVDIIRSLNDAAKNSWVMWTKLSSDEYKNVVSIVVAEHTKVYDAIAGQDPDRARAAMRTHLSTAVDRMLGAADSGTE
jgi:DNA-binding FadR family transcriptional regulator